MRRTTGKRQLEGVTIRPVNPGDEGPIADLLALTRGLPQGRRPGADARVLWKMSSHPLAEGRQLVAVEDDRIIGCLLKIVRAVLVRRQPRLARDAVDLAVQPGHQGRGIYSAMSDYSLEHLDGPFDLLMSHSGHPAVDRRRRQLGYRDLANRLQVMVRVEDAARFAADRGSRLPRWLDALRLRGMSLLGRASHRRYRRPQETDWSIATVEGLDERIDAFFARAAAPFDFIVAKTRGYLHWRYLDPRSGAFRIRVASREDEILGFVVFEVVGERGLIVDLLALPGRADVVRSLIEDALRALRAASVAAAVCWIPSHHPYDEVLRRYGFVDLGGTTGFMYGPLNIDPAELEFLRDPRASVHLVMGDSDLP